MLRIRSLVALVAAAVAIPSGFAAPCAGFTDVDSADSFCPNVDWLKNRAITLGCSATLFCPNDAVTRLAMAAFMNRLGTAMTPSTLYHDTSGGTLDLDNQSQPICSVDAGSAAYPRSAHAGAILSARFGPDPGTVGVRIVQSTNGGATWTPVHAVPGRAAAVDSWINATAWRGAMQLAALTSYRLGMTVERAGMDTGDLQQWRCQLKVDVFSRTGAVSPF